MAWDARLVGPAVYFQPPTSVTMKYPCIVYQLDTLHTIHADDNPYRVQDRYSVTVIDPDPDTKIPDYIAHLPTATFNRYFVSDNLNHYVFQIYY